MESFTVYTCKTTRDFRVVAGEHAKMGADYAKQYSVHVYQGATATDAAHAAYSAWKGRRPAIAEQIARFFTDDTPPKNSKRSAPGHSAEPSGRETVPGADNTGDTPRMRISQWLSEHVGSHDIQSAPALERSFFEATGLTACWPVHTVRETRRRIANDVRGGEVHGDDEQKVTYGYEVAIALATKFVQGFYSTKMGRGFAFNEALEALKSVEL